jgi:hypothetical protein
MNVEAGTFKITDVEAYITESKTKYRSTPPGSAMQSAVEVKIRNRIGKPGDINFPSRDGPPGYQATRLPGYQAEVRAMNEIFTKYPDIDPGSVSISTMQLQANHAVENFKACYNCTNITGGFDVITGTLDVD